jgi:hypothetical protein
MQLQQRFRLTAILWTEAAAAKHDHHRILSLQFGEFSMLPCVVAELVVREDSSRDDVGSHLNFLHGVAQPGLRPLQINHDVALGARAADQHIPLRRCVDRIRLIVDCSCNEAGLAGVTDPGAA